MTDAIRGALLREVHRSTAEAADAALARIALASSDSNASGPVLLSYPPGDARTESHVLTPKDTAALASIATSDAVMSALRKLLREAASVPVFHLCCLLDGVADPEDWNGGDWLGADIVPPQDDEWREMLHDQFFESYWAFIEG